MKKLGQRSWVPNFGCTCLYVSKMIFQYQSHPTGDGNILCKLLLKHFHSGSQSCWVCHRLCSIHLVTNTFNLEVDEIWSLSPCVCEFLFWLQCITKQFSNKMYASSLFFFFFLFFFLKNTWSKAYYQETSDCRTQRSLMWRNVEEF